LAQHSFGPLLHAKFHPHRCKVSPLLGKKSQNHRLSNLNAAGKNSTFGGGGWNLSLTKLGVVIEDLQHVLVPPKSLGFDG